MSARHITNCLGIFVCATFVFCSPVSSKAFELDEQPSVEVMPLDGSMLSSRTRMAQLDFPPTTLIEGTSPSYTPARYVAPVAQPQQAVVPATLPSAPSQDIAYQPPENNAVFGPQPYMNLGTRMGIDIGAQISDYRYHEPTGGVKIQGLHYGGSLGITGVVGDGFFGTLEGSGVTGDMDYHGSSNTIHDQTNTEFEARGLFGKDLVFRYYSVSPYAGIGYRYVDNDLSGTLVGGSRLHERENALWYVPIGVHPRFHIDENSRISSTFEYDFLLHGEETSHLGDTGNGDPTVINDQDTNGFGFRVDVMYETKWWSIGPYGRYWSINTSNRSAYTSSGSSCGSTSCALTIPYNHTIEVGLQFKVHLF